MYKLRTEEEGKRFLYRAVQSHAPAFLSGVQEVEEDCLTEATTPTSFEPIDQSQMSTVELDELATEKVTPSPGEFSPVDQDTSPAETVRPPEEEANPTEADVAQPEEPRDSEKREEPDGDTDSSSQSVDELLADWREDLEAFQQMEKDEL